MSHYLGVAPKPRSGRNREQEIEYLESLIATATLPRARLYNNWAWRGPNVEEAAITAAGREMVMSLGPSGPSGSWLHADVAAGRHDADIDATANAIGTWGHPIALCYTHEPENANHRPAGTAPQFVAAYRHIIDRFRSTGVPNVTSWDLIMEAYSYNPASGAGGVPRVVGYDPGPTYIDRYGGDGYNWLTRDGTHKSFQTVFAAMVSWLTANRPTKKWLIGEVGTEEDPADATFKANWILAMLATLKLPAWANFEDVLWFNSQDPTHGYQWYFDTSANSIAAFHTIASDPFFTQLGGPPPPPPPPPTDPEAPSVSILAPADGSRLTSRTTTLTVSASDPDGIASVRYRVVGGSIYTDLPSIGGGRYSQQITLPGTAGASVTSQIEVVATDSNATPLSTTAVVEVTVALPFRGRRRQRATPASTSSTPSTNAAAGPALAGH